MQNEERSQLCVRRQNLELADARLTEEEDPSLCQALQRLALCREGQGFGVNPPGHRREGL